ncbi:hypothetical protein DJ030_03790 [bacterium endosymbiont of Escarpia laminata]|nr:MAG: hypothetical protein DJ030_03790 [bacterium endosymbiont of Escarpia laminata]
MIIIDIHPLIHAAAQQLLKTCNFPTKEHWDRNYTSVLNGYITRAASDANKFGDAPVVLVLDSSQNWRCVYHPGYKMLRSVNKKALEEGRSAGRGLSFPEHFRQAWLEGFELNDCSNDTAEWDGGMLGLNDGSNIPPSHQVQIYYAMSLANQSLLAGGFSIGRYKAISIRHAEADDIIGVLTREPGRHVVVSGDKDFKQLLSSNVKMMHPITMEEITVEDYSLQDHILQGDVIDGIPSVLNPLDHYICSRKRAKPMTKKQVIRLKAGNITDEEKVRIEQNTLLIDLRCIPSKLERLVQKWISAWNMGVRVKN